MGNLPGGKSSRGGKGALPTLEGRFYGLDNVQFVTVFFLSLKTYSKLAGKAPAVVAFAPVRMLHQQVSRSHHCGFVGVYALTYATINGTRTDALRRLLYIG